VIADEAMRTRLPFIIAERAIAVYGPAEKNMWQYLDQIEADIEYALSNPTVAAAGAMVGHILEEDPEAFQPA
jgi:hypothetical protein